MLKNLLKGASKPMKVQVELLNNYNFKNCPVLIDFAPWTNQDMKKFNSSKMKDTKGSWESETLPLNLLSPPQITKSPILRLQGKGKTNLCSLLNGSSINFPNKRETCLSTPVMLDQSTCLTIIVHLSFQQGYWVNSMLCANG